MGARLLKDGYPVYEVSFVGSRGSRAMAVDAVAKIRRVMGFRERLSSEIDDEIQAILVSIYADKAQRRRTGT